MWWRRGRVCPFFTRMKLLCVLHKDAPHILQVNTVMCHLPIINSNCKIECLSWHYHRNGPVNGEKVRYTRSFRSCRHLYSLFVSWWYSFLALGPGLLLAQDMWTTLAICVLGSFSLQKYSRLGFSQSLPLWLKRHSSQLRKGWDGSGGNKASPKRLSHIPEPLPCI